MKNFLFALFTFSSLLVASQVPQSFNYQAVARNLTGSILANQFISVEISIRDGSPTSPIVYQEIDTATTNQFGLFTVAIGTGQLQSGNFTTINWATGNKYLQVGFDQTGGNNFTNMGTTELLSVPYALYAANSGAVSNSADYAIYTESQLNNISPQTVLVDSNWAPRRLNTTEAYAGTSIARNGYYITLQPGTYHVSASAQWGLTISEGTIVGGAGNYQELAKSLLAIVDSSNNLNTLLLGQAENHSILYLGNTSPPVLNVGQLAQNGNPIESYSISIEGVITIAAITTVTLRHYISYPFIDGLNGEYLTFTSNAGFPMSLGLPNETYSRIFIQKIN